MRPGRELLSAGEIVSEDIGAADVLSVTSIGSGISAGGDFSFFSQLSIGNARTANDNEIFIKLYLSGVIPKGI